MGRIPPPANRECPICHTAFYASPGHIAQGWGIYCSIPCRVIGRRPKPNCTCQTCGKEFSLKPYSVARGEGKYCSRECQFDGRSSIRACKVCGQEFKTYASQPNSQYCSTACMGQGNSQKQTAICVTCGAEFSKKPSWFRHKKGAGSFCSMQCKAKMMSKTQLTTGGVDRAPRGGRRADLGGMYVRSGWEANYARYLNWLLEHGEIQKWEFEPDTFEFVGIKRGSRFYTPDFKVTQKDGDVEYHEVKGRMDAKSKTKLKRMKKYHPNVTIVLIDGPVYHSIARTMRPIIGDAWE